MGDSDQHSFDGTTGSRSKEEWLRLIARSPPVVHVRAEELIGETVDGKYRVDALLGRGGMGLVLRATHLGTGREVALKVLAPELTANEAAIERFRREARAAGRIRHPNVVDVTDFGFANRGGDRLAYLVMELLRGKTLRALLDERGPLSVDDAIDVLHLAARPSARRTRHGPARSSPDGLRGSTPNAALADADARVLADAA